MTVKALNALAGALAAIALVMILCAAVAGCDWKWQKTAKVTLTSKEAGLATADKVGLGYYQRQCRSIAKKCPPGTDEKTCAKLGECWTQRRLFQAVLDRTALGLAAAWTAAVAGDQSSYKAKLAVLVASFKDLSKMLSQVMGGD
jgi:hypothetical protein